MSGIRCIDKLETPLPCDVAEWCPNEGAQRMLAVGTYKLDEASQQRRGALHMFRLDGDDGGGRLLPLPAAGLPLPGVFDLRWQPRSAMPQLAAALADGSLRLLQWSGGEGGLSDGGAGAAPPAELAVLPGPPPVDGGGGGDGCCPSTAMAVSLDFTRAPGGTAEKLVGSYSSGQLQLFQVKGGEGLCHIRHAEASSLLSPSKPEPGGQAPAPERQKGLALLRPPCLPLPFQRSAAA
jgi:hypothetical protein